MAGVRFADLQSRPTEFLDFTSLTLDEFQQLVPPFQRVPELSLTDPGGAVAVYSRLCEDVLPSGGPGTPLRHGSEQSESVAPRPPARAAGGPACPW